MDETKKLAVAYGGFACVLEGFDNPFPTMRKVVRYFQEISENHPDFAGYHQVADFEELRARLGKDSEAGRLSLEPIAGGVQIRRFDVLADDTAIAPAPPLAEDSGSEGDTVRDVEHHDGPQPVEADAWHQTDDAPAGSGEEPTVRSDGSDEVQEAAAQPVAEPAADPGEFAPEVAEDADTAPMAEAEADGETEAEAEADVQTRSEALHGAHAEPVEPADEQPAAPDEAPEPALAETPDHGITDGQSAADGPTTDEPRHDHHWQGDSLVFANNPSTPADAPPAPAESTDTSDRTAPTEPTVEGPAPLPVGPESGPDPESEPRAEVEPEPAPEPEPQPQPAPRTAESEKTPDPAPKPVAALRLGPEMARKPDAERPVAPSFIDTIEEKPKPGGGLFRARTPAPAPTETPAAKVDKPDTPPAPQEADTEPKRRGLGPIKLGGLLRRKDADTAPPEQAPAATTAEPPARKPAHTADPVPAAAPGRLRVVEGDAQDTPPQPAITPPPPADVVREVPAETPAAAPPEPAPAPKPAPKPAPTPEPAAAQQSPGSPSDAMKDRLHASFADQRDPAPTTMNIGPGEGDSDPGSPAGFARAVGAASLPEMMAAAAGYMMMIEDRDRVTRPDIMTMVQAVAGDTPLSAEAKVKAFGKLVRSGQIVRADGGQFFLSAETVAEFQAKLNELV